MADPGLRPICRQMRPRSDCYCDADVVSVKYDFMSDTGETQMSRGSGIRGSSKLRKSERTRRAILDGALKFLWTHPFRDLTVAELMALTGTSRSAFYQYFQDLHDLMETLLRGLEEDIFRVAAPWFKDEGEPTLLLQETIEGLVRVCYQQGPVLRAVSDAAPMDARLEKAWKGFLCDFDDAVTAQIEKQQQAGGIKPFDARAVAIALNRMNAALMINHFGQRPRGNQVSVCTTVTRIWITTLYGDHALNDINS